MGNIPNIRQFNYRKMSIFLWQNQNSDTYSVYFLSKLITFAVQKSDEQQHCIFRLKAFINEEY